MLHGLFGCLAAWVWLPSCPVEGWKGNSERPSSARISSCALTDILCACNEVLDWEMSVQSTLLEWAGSSPHFPEPAAAAGQQGLGAVKASAQAGDGREKLILMCDV